MVAVSELEGAWRTRLLPTGLAAIGMALLSYLKPGDHVLVTDSAYQPVRHLTQQFLQPYGIECSFFAADGSDAAARMQANTRMVYAECPGSLVYEMCDLPALAELAHRHGALLVADNTWGSGVQYRRIADLLRAEGTKVNDKRVYRLYRLAELSVRKRRGKQRLKLERVPLHQCQSVNEVWSMDFVSDSLSSGRRIKCLTVTDDFSHECVDIAVDRGISGAYVVRVLEQVALFRGYPQAVRTDQGPEFTSRAFMAWAQAKGVRHILNQPGKPTQNAYIESFNGKFRDECLNEHWFQSLKQARVEIARWRIDYNEVRPHSSCGRMPPAKFAAMHRQTTSGTASAPLQTQE